MYSDDVERKITDVKCVFTSISDRRWLNVSGCQMPALFLSFFENDFKITLLSLF